ncbi:MAG TPA: D-glycerate dehydrogenase [Candidatus Avacidaminococcus intestinavium]|uniref:Glyoxylate/hydroxypyruvate reductase B n=1 Tax=Candidatus Avacidaminococcus intestinavium TaxID=2840684 RepID=A0A9D1SKQ1_9FIRM|nr:D-glycerate dehydrogenase [Candidatus Avacidaminococcus intestinavium]
MLKEMQVLATGKLRDTALNILRAQVILHDWQKGGKRPENEFYALLQEADALYSIGNVKIDESFLARAPKLKVIAQASVGYDNIDIAACQKFGVRVGNTPGVLVDAVADLAYALLIDTARGIVRGHEHVKSGAWGARKGVGFGVDLAGKIVGIIGMGAIGAALAKRAQASKMQIVYHNTRVRTDEAEMGAQYVALEELLKISDFIVVSVPLTQETTGLIGTAEFAKMKPTARFINTSRGKVVDTMALYEALRTGEIAAAALDVVDPEPLPSNHPLLTLSNITITPHIGTSTVETRDQMATLAANNIIAALRGDAMPAEVV